MTFLTISRDPHVYLQGFTAFATCASVACLIISKIALLACDIFNATPTNHALAGGIPLIFSAVIFSAGMISIAIDMFITVYQAQKKTSITTTSSTT